MPETKRSQETPSGESALEAKVRRMEDELAIRNLAAQFSDAVARWDYESFRALWAPRAVWEIKEPLHSLANGVDEIVALLRRLLDGREFFVQLTHSGIVHVHGDEAVARWIVRERGRGPGKTFYDNLAVYVDALVKIEGQWLFSNRTYHYIFLDDSEFGGKSFPHPV